MKSRLILLLYFVMPLMVFSQIDSSYQPMEFIRPTVVKLCSPEFHGRGYVDNGMREAGNYIASRMQEFHMTPLFGGDYLQKFQIAANSVEKIIVSLDGKKLKPGYDYIIDPTSGDIAGNYRLSNAPDIYKEDMVSLSHNLDYDMQADTSSHLLFTEAATIYPERGKFIFHSGLHSALRQAKKIKINLDNETKIHTVANVAGMIPGKVDSYVLVTAHYDHLGMLGDAMFPGASDNASGTAMMMSLADYFSRIKPYYNLVFIAFASEETGLVGSQYFVENTDIQNFPIKMVINLDIMGNAEGGITVVNTEEQIGFLEELRKINEDKEIGMVEIRQRGNTQNSDHYPFTRVGIPAVFIYSNGGPGYYHDVEDTPAHLGYKDVDKIFYLLNYYIQNAQ